MSLKERKAAAKAKIAEAEQQRSCTPPVVQDLAEYIDELQRAGKEQPDDTPCECATRKERKAAVKARMIQADQQRAHITPDVQDLADYLADLGDFPVGGEAFQPSVEYDDDTPSALSEDEWVNILCFVPDLSTVCLVSQRVFCAARRAAVLRVWGNADFLMGVEGSCWCLAALCTTSKVNLSAPILSIAYNKALVPPVSFALRYNSFITTVDLTHCDITGERIASVLMTNSTLKKLNLDHNLIKEGGAVRLAAALTVNRSLESLSLRYNLIGNRGGAALTEALLSNTSLCEVGLQMCAISDTGAKAMAANLSEISTCGTLYLRGNGIVPSSPLRTAPYSWTVDFHVP